MAELPEISVDIYNDAEPKEPSEEVIKLAKEITELDYEHKKLKKQATNIWNKKEILERNLIEKMEILGMKSFRHDDIGLISVGQKIWGKIVDIDKAREYFEANGIADALLELRVKSTGGQARLNEIIKDCIANGQTIPQGVDYSQKFYIMRRS